VRGWGEFGELTYQAKGVTTLEHRDPDWREPASQRSNSWLSESPFTTPKIEPIYSEPLFPWLKRFLGGKHG